MDEALAITTLASFGGFCVTRWPIFGLANTVATVWLAINVLS